MGFKKRFKRSFWFCEPYPVNLCPSMCSPCVCSALHRHRCCSSWLSWCHLPVTLLGRSFRLPHRNKPRVSSATKVTAQSLLRVSYSSRPGQSFPFRAMQCVCGGLYTRRTDIKVSFDYFYFNSWYLCYQFRAWLAGTGGQFLWHVLHFLPLRHGHPGRS